MLLILGMKSFENTRDKFLVFDSRGFFSLHCMAMHFELVGQENKLAL